MTSPNSQPFTFSQRAQKITSSTIREILKVTERPEIISFAGGLPAAKGFPVDTICGAFDRVLTENGNLHCNTAPPRAIAPCVNGWPKT